ncbi:MAG: hypothetical protein FE78DRAFT_423244 [Acidomyces sp. 'richmondensis']|nr:MAG: hypothetical protein FE78DRAFT_423244 [Acidomyces sp. 'richmondensis']
MPSSTHEKREQEDDHDSDSGWIDHWSLHFGDGLSDSDLNVPASSPFTNIELQYFNHPSPHQDRDPNEIAFAGSGFKEAPILKEAQELANFEVANPHVSNEQEGYFIGQKKNSYASDPRRQLRLYCRICGWENESWNTPSDRNKHELIHLPRRIVCDFCDKRFLYPKDKTKHANAIHFKEHFRCPFCLEDYTNHDNRVRHIRKEHPGCPIPARNDTGQSVPSAPSSLSTVYSPTKSSVCSSSSKLASETTLSSTAGDDVSCIDPQLRFHRATSTQALSRTSKEDTTNLGSIAALSSPRQRTSPTPSSPLLKKRTYADAVKNSPRILADSRSDGMRGNNYAVATPESLTSTYMSPQSSRTSLQRRKPPKLLVQQRADAGFRTIPSRASRRTRSGPDELSRGHLGCK